MILVTNQCAKTFCPSWFPIPQTNNTENKQKLELGGGGGGGGSAGG